MGDPTFGKRSFVTAATPRTRRNGSDSRGTPAEARESRRVSTSSRRRARPRRSASANPKAPSWRKPGAPTNTHISVILNVTLPSNPLRCARSPPRRSCIAVVVEPSYDVFLTQLNSRMWWCRRLACFSIQYINSRKADISTVLVHIQNVLRLAPQAHS